MLFQFVYRNIKKRPLLNFIKILGLSLGLSGILFITLFLKNELTYDNFHAKAKRIYRFTITNPTYFGSNHFARIYNSEEIPSLAAYFPEIENYVRLSPIRGGVMMHNEEYYSINEAFICDSTFFNVFDANLLVGDKQTILNNPGSMVVSASFARKVFGKENPVGQIMTIPAGQFYGENSNYTIKGIMKDFPSNSHFHPDLITTPARDKINWWAYTYFVLHKNANPENITSRYADFLAKQTEQSDDKTEAKAFLQKITDIHLHSDKLREIEENGNMTNIYVLAFAALILLLISISNFTSLNIGMSGFNNKFIAINQILGSTQNTNVKYSAIESSYIILASVILTVLISIPVNLLILKYFDINLFQHNYLFIVTIILVFSALSLLAGLYPALKQNIKLRVNNASLNLVKAKKTSVNKGIIIIQYTFAIILIASVIIITRQVNFALNNSMGMKEDNIICFESVHSSIQEKFNVFKAELLKQNTIESVSAMLEPPGGEANDILPFDMEGFQLNEDKSNNQIGIFPCDYSFANLFKLQFLSGNNFTKKNIDTEGSGEYIINETAMHQLNFNNPNKIIGKNFKLIFSSPAINIPSGKIIGVVKDFHLSSMKKKINPLVMFKRDKMWLLNFVVAYKPGLRKAAITDIKKVWTEMFPTYPFSYEYIDTMYGKVYKTELLQAKLLSIFTIISMFICSMGLLGISLLVSQQRTKEIGVRKVNGARVSEILTMLNKSFVKWVAIAFVIATPIAYYAMNKWLENFAYKTTLSLWIFALAGLLALGIALLTVSWQSWRAATRNPVEALRNE